MEEERVYMQTGGVQASLAEGEDGRTELAWMKAVGGVSYVDKNIEFEGAEFVYDGVESILRAQGGPDQECILNGTPVKSLEYNLKTGKVAAEVTGPGAVMVEGE
jgi:hypothetical protein